jgi:hypothetical protein
MNLRSWINLMAGAVKRPAATTDVFRQTRRSGLLYPTPMMSSSAPRVLAVCAVCATVFSFIASAQTNYYGTNGTEYAVIGSLPGDQMFPDAALSTNGGLVVWQDNATDGSGWGVSARRVDRTLSGTLSTFRVNAQGSNDQENARVTLLKNGGAAFVWQGGKEGYQHIFARYLTPTNTWLTTTDLVVSTFTNNFQVNPAIATLNNSNVVIVWASFNQANTNSLLDVYAKILSPVGATVKSEFLVNQVTNYNQRTPSVAALKNGGFVVAWVSEQQRVAVAAQGTNSTYRTASSTLVPSVDIYARMFSSNGIAAGNEFVVNPDYNVCANPAVASASDGSFMVAWSRRDMATTVNGWDVYARAYSAAGIGGTVSRANTFVTGNQYAPRLVAIGLDYLVVWTSLSQDGSREGVYGQFLHSDGSLTGGEFRVNSTTASQQMQPVVATDGANQFLVVWTSYTGNLYSFDLYAQRFANVNSILQAMSAPFVSAPFVVSNNVYQPQLQVAWAPLLGIAVSNYQVYVDGAATPMAVTTSNIWTMTTTQGLTNSSTHSFQVGYVRADAQVSPLSAATSGTTWSGANYFGIPSEWVQTYYGLNVANWPANVNAPLAAGGPSLLQVFLSGGSPLNSSTWLKTALVKTSQGFFLNWNTQPGFIYQVKTTTDLVSWQNLGTPRFAAGTNDSIYVGASSAGYYRVYLLR